MAAIFEPLAFLSAGCASNLIRIVNFVKRSIYKLNYMYYYYLLNIVFYGKPTETGMN